MIGRTIGNYVVKTKIGEGGMGAVYAAEHPRIGRRVAIKVLHPELGKSPEIVARFFTEAKAANEIHNDHIIEILDFGELPDGISYFIMEWLDGTSLSSALAAQPQFPLPRAMHVVRGIGRALAAAHAKGIVHRDLKPDNVFLIRRGDDPDFVKVLDFGIAKLMTNDISQGFKTQTGAIMGTPYYMSPEQCRGATKDIDHRTDIYALGCILYQMVTGRLPFNAEGLGELLLQHMTRPPTPPTAIDPSIPQDVEACILKALEKEPAKRWSSVAEMMNSMSGAITNLSGPIVALEQPKQPSAPTSRSIPPAPAQPTGAPLSMTTLGGAAAEAVRSKTVSRGRSTFVIGGVVVGVAAIGLLVVLRRSPAPQPQPQPPQQQAVVKPEPQPEKKAEIPPPEKKTTAAITIKTTPDDAVVLLDGAEMPHKQGAFKLGDEQHELVVKAAGYQAEKQWVVFDQDKTFEIKLRKGHGTHESKGVTKGTAVATPSTTSPSPSTSTPPPTTPPQPEVAEKKPEKKVEKPTNDTVKPAYQGKKAKLITDYPE